MQKFCIGEKSNMHSLGRIGIVGVPYDTGSRRLQLGKGAEALRNAGIATALGQVGEVVDFGDLTVDLPALEQSDPKLLNSDRVEALCRVLAKKVSIVVASGCFTFIVGGECSQLMGIIEGLRTMKLGVVYMDAHGDFNTPETTPSGTIGGMSLSIAAGRGSKRLTTMFGRSPLLDEENIILYGVRDLDPLEAKALAESKVIIYSRQQIRTQSAAKIAEQIIAHLKSKCDGIYLHVDLDVLDESVFSAQSLPVPDGLSREEFQTTLKILVKSGKLRCVALMSFDAAKDANGSQAKRLVDMVIEALK